MSTSRVPDAQLTALFDLLFFAMNGIKQRISQLEYQDKDHLDQQPQTGQLTVMRE